MPFIVTIVLANINADIRDRICFMFIYHVSIQYITILIHVYLKRRLVIEPGILYKFDGKCVTEMETERAKNAVSRYAFMENG